MAGVWGTGPLSAAAVTASDARRLAWLRDETGEAFAAGVILHTGPHVFPVADRVAAPVFAPVFALWTWQGPGLLGDSGKTSLFAGTRDARA